ncbi:MAG: MerR family transcriptional regulator [Myxococcota bacterium]|nr:MerR family transcriptional regulator [Myxococcota bacterium]
MNKTDENGLLSIGGLAIASGVSAETLRNWERRYGFPRPERRISGHRRYPLSIVSRLRLIRQVTDQGYKPSFAVTADVDELERILRETERKSREKSADDPTQKWQREVDQWLVSISRFDAEEIEVGLRRAWFRYGAFDFLTKLAVPFLRAVGDRWSVHDLTVAEEHFASEILQGFLMRQWRPLSEQAGNTRVVLATLEGERHCLGLHMAAVFLVLSRIEVIYLGPSTPRLDITGAAKKHGAAAVVIGASTASKPTTVAAELAKLRDALPLEVAVVVGGNEDLPEMEGIVYVTSLEDFADWTGTFARTRRSPFEKGG